MTCPKNRTASKDLRADNTTVNTFVTIRQGNGADMYRPPSTRPPFLDCYYHYYLLLGEFMRKEDILCLYTSNKALDHDPFDSVQPVLVYINLTTESFAHYTQLIIHPRTHW